MTEKRYYEKRYGEEFYIFDSKIISEKDFEKKLEIQGYKAFEDSLTGKEIIDLLNENEELKIRIGFTADVLQKHYNYAYDQACRNIDNVLIYNAYGVLKHTIVSIADELNIELNKFPENEITNDNNLNGVIYSYVIEFGKTKFYKNGRFMTSSEVLNELDVKDMIINQFSEENKELKIKNDLLSDELEQAKAVINKKWDEYLKKKELSE